METATFRCRWNNFPKGLFLATLEEVPGLIAHGRTVGEALDIERDVATKSIEARRDRDDARRYWNTTVTPSKSRSGSRPQAIQGKRSLAAAPGGHPLRDCIQIASQPRKRRAAHTSFRRPSPSRATRFPTRHCKTVTALWRLTTRALHAIFLIESDLRGNASNRRRDGSYRDRREVWDRAVARQQKDRSFFAGRSESIKPNLPRGLVSRPCRLGFPPRRFVLRRRGVANSRPGHVLPGIEWLSAEVFTRRVAHQRRTVALHPDSRAVGCLKQRLIEHDLDGFHVLIFNPQYCTHPGKRIPAAVFGKPSLMGLAACDQSSANSIAPLVLWPDTCAIRNRLRFISPRGRCVLSRIRRSRIRDRLPPKGTAGRAGNALFARVYLSPGHALQSYARRIVEIRAFCGHVFFPVHSQPRNGRTDAIPMRHSVWFWNPGGALNNQHIHGHVLRLLQMQAELFFQCAKDVRDQCRFLCARRR